MHLTTSQPLDSEVSSYKLSMDHQLQDSLANSRGMAHLAMYKKLDTKENFPAFPPYSKPLPETRCWVNGVA